MSDYEYEAFFSYKRDPESDDWHRRVKNQLHHWLKNSDYGGEGRIFFDTAEIKTGDDWNERLANALRRSKTLVCIWSPDYFRSRYCRSEWKTFQARIQYLEAKYAKERDEAIANGMAPPEPPELKPLVIGAAYHDGNRFPDEAKASQYKVFHPYAKPLEAFWKTDDAVKFVDVLKEFAEHVSLKIAACPPYDDNFPVLLDQGPDEEVPCIRRPAGNGQ